LLLLKGVHPHGRTLEEAIRRIKKKFKTILTLEKIDESIRRASFLDLLNQMLSYEDAKRPTTSQILDHPFFKIHFVISVQQQEEEQVPYMENLMLSPIKTKAPTPVNFLRPTPGDGSQQLGDGIEEQETDVTR
jgi:serine/threonine protein kinase